MSYSYKVEGKCKLLHEHIVVAGRGQVVSIWGKRTGSARAWPDVGWAKRIESSPRRYTSPATMSLVKDKVKQR